MPKGYKGAYSATRKIKIGSLTKSKVASRSMKQTARRKGMT